MTTIQLKEFIKTGKFGSISIGSTKTDIVNVLGKKFEFANCDEAQIIKYGWYEFFYWTETEILFGIQNDHVQADCTNHKEMINYKSKLWTIDKWPLQDNKNMTFGEVEYFLKEENIPYEIIPAYKVSHENVIKCSDSNVAFDFVNEYSLVEINKNGKFKNQKEFVEGEQHNYILNGIRIIEY